MDELGGPPLHRTRLPLLSVLVAGLALAGCGGGDNSPMAPPASTAIAGSVTVQPGSPADPTNARAAVYTSLADFNNDAWAKQAAVQRNGTAWSFTIPDLNAGNYYVDVWRDNNNNGVIDAGDIYGYYSTGQGGAPAPVLVNQGATASVTLQVRLNKVSGKAGR